MQAGADLTAVASRGTTGLHAASYYGHLESVVIMSVLGIVTVVSFRFFLAVTVSCWDQFTLQYYQFESVGTKSVLSFPRGLYSSVSCYFCNRTLLYALFVTSPFRRLIYEHIESV